MKRKFKTHIYTNHTLKLVHISFVLIYLIFTQIVTKQPRWYNHQKKSVHFKKNFPKAEPESTCPSRDVCALSTPRLPSHLVVSTQRMPSGTGPTGWAFPSATKSTRTFPNTPSQLQGSHSDWRGSQDDKSFAIGTLHLGRGEQNPLSRWWQSRQTLQ